MTTLKPRPPTSKGTGERAVLCKVKKMKNRGVTKEEYEENVAVIFRSGKKDANLTNYVVQGSGRIRRLLLEAGRMFVRWGSHRVRDFISVTRYFRCQAFGNVQRT